MLPLIGMQMHPLCAVYQLGKVSAPPHWDFLEIVYFAIGSSSQW